MGRRGPLPKKDGLRVQSGQLPISKKAMTEILKPFDPPTCPEHMSEDEKRVWTTTVELLRPTRSISAKDQAVLAAYCNSYVQWVTAEKDIQKIAKEHGISGLVMKSQSGLMINPLVTISRRAKADMVYYAAQLGMTPAARNRSSEGTGTRRENPFLLIKANNEKKLDEDSKAVRKVSDPEEEQE